MTTFGLLSLADHLADPASGRKSSQAERYRIIVESAAWAEAAGFEHVGLGEHHFSDYIVPSPLLLLATIAARTRTIRLGTCVTLLASQDPLRVAEDLATLDVISDGRAEMTFARGVIASNVTAFGITDGDLRPRFEENLRLVLRLLTEERVTWSGRYRAPLHEVRLEPRLLQAPHQALFVGSGLSQISCDLAADLGLPLTLPSLFRYPEDFLPIVDRYREKMDRNGFADRIGVSFPSYVHVARTSQEARARWRPYLESYVRFATEHRGSFGRPLDFEGLLAGPAICGSPAEVVDRIAATNAVLGLSVHYLMPDLGGLPGTLLQEVIELLGGEVLPRVRGSDAGRAVV
jgi:alkanesulfonate monooxygenase SsuD/methylene tetrahydromethanopterin reductase-like flavin-dependent oxidoreductase (luciferase family)